MDKISIIVEIEFAREDYEVINLIVDKCHEETVVQIIEDVKAHWEEDEDDEFDGAIEELIEQKLTVAGIQYENVPFRVVNWPYYY